MTILDALAKAGVAFVALKENIRVDGERDIQTKVMTTLFALFAEVERDLISERTREGLARARSSGRKLGRPKGSLGVSRLDGKEDEIRHFLELGVSKTAIAKITGVSRTALYSFQPLHRLLRPAEPHLDPLPRNRHPLGQARQLRVEGLDGKRHPDPGHPRLPEFGDQAIPTFHFAAEGGPGPVFPELAEELRPGQRSLVAGHLGAEGLHEGGGRVLRGGDP